MSRKECPAIAASVWRRPCLSVARASACALPREQACRSLLLRAGGAPRVGVTRGPYFSLVLRALLPPRQFTRRFHHPLAPAPIRALPRLDRAHNGPFSRGTRPPLVPHKQMPDHAVHPQIFFPAQARIFVERYVLHPPDSPRLRRRRKRLAHAPLKRFTRCFPKHGPRFYPRPRHIQQYFRTIPAACHSTDFQGAPRQPLLNDKLPRWYDPGVAT